LLTSLLVLRIAPRNIWLALPLLLIAVFLLLPYAKTPLPGIGLYRPFPAQHRYRVGTVP
jgi:hypothetical protein